MAAHRNLLFTDTETLGLDPMRFELIEIGAVLTTPDGQRVIQEFEARVNPIAPDNFELKAAEVNGYNPGTWAPTHTREQAADQFCELAREVTLVGQNIGFDEGHLLAFVNRTNRKATWHYHKVDNAAMAWPLFKQNKLKYVSMATLCEFFGIAKEPDPHRAINGARTSRLVYLKLMELYSKLFA
jgi:DNA polymerase III epsilon subunit-like protein